MRDICHLLRARLSDFVLFARRVVCFEVTTRRYGTERARLSCAADVRRQRAAGGSEWSAPMFSAGVRK